MKYVIGSSLILGIASLYFFGIMTTILVAFFVLVVYGIIKELKDMRY